MRTKLLLAASVLLLMACAQEKDLNDDSLKKSSYSSAIKAQIADFVLDDNTKATISISGKVSTFKWSAGDQIGVWPLTVSGGQTAQQHLFTTEENESSSASFTGSGWALLTDGSHEYCAYYPYDSGSEADIISLSFSTLDNQAGNARIDHLFPYLYMFADPIVPDSPAECSFNFNQLGCMLIFDLNGLSGKNIRRLQVSFAEDVFKTNVTYNPTEGPIALVPVTSASKITLGISSSGVPSGDGRFIFYQIVSPAEVAGKTMTITVGTSQGDFQATYECTKDWQSGKAYKYVASVTTPKPAGVETKEGVDLGTGILWATMNVGASCIEDQGSYIHWGGLADRTARSRSKEYAAGETLDPADDVAAQNWGSGWRMPTSSEIIALVNQCDSEEDCVNGVYGMRVYNHSDHTKNIFIPFSGHGGGGQMTSLYIWSSTAANDSNAYYCNCSKGSNPIRTTHGMSNYFCVRPVKDM